MLGELSDFFPHHSWGPKEIIWVMLCLSYDRSVWPVSLIFPWVAVTQRLKVRPCHILLLLLSHVWLVTPWTVPRQASLSFIISLSLLKLMSIESVMPSNHLILCHPFSSSLRSFPASGSFPVSQFFASGGRRIGASASASVLPMNIQDWFPLGLTGLISLLSKGLSRVFSSSTIQKHQFLSAQPSLWSNSHVHTWLLEKPYLWIYRPLSAK